MVELLYLRHLFYNFQVSAKKCYANLLLQFKSDVFSFYFFSPKTLYCSQDKTFLPRFLLKFPEKK